MIRSGWIIKCMGDFIYDGSGTRVAKTVTHDGQTNETVYIGDIYEVRNNTIIKYIFAGNLRVAMIKNNTTTYYHKDHLGSSTVLTNEAGFLTNNQKADYLPFGFVRGDDNITDTAYKFTDQEFDDETGLYNYNARLYDPVLGMFISADTIVPDMFNSQSLNRYAYCLNNPVKYNDPDGHMPSPILGDTEAIRAYEDLYNAATHLTVKAKVGFEFFSSKIGAFGIALVASFNFAEGPKFFRQHSFGPAKDQIGEGGGLDFGGGLVDGHPQEGSEDEINITTGLISCSPDENNNIELSVGPGISTPFAVSKVKTTTKQIHIINGYTNNSNNSNSSYSPGDLTGNYTDYNGYNHANTYEDEKLGGYW